MAVRRKASFHAKRKKVKEPGNAPPVIINQKIEVQQRWNRKPQEIPDWRKAVQSAESQIPRRNMLYNLYADVDLDGHVEAVTSKRRDAVTDANWKFLDKDGKDVDEINEIIDTIGFDNLVHEIINAKFWGYSIMEPRFWKDGDNPWEMDAGLIPRLFYRPEIGVVAYNHVGDEGINIREDIYARTVMEVGQVIDLGLYMKAAPYAILKRGGVGDYAMFIQTYGNPLIDAVYQGHDETQRLKLKNAFSEMGAGGTLIRPDGTEVTMMESNAKNTGDAHGGLLNFLNSEISKALLGTTETTQSSESSGYAQSKTHSDEDDRKHDNDITYTRKYLNSRFITILKAAGFDTRGGSFDVQGEETELSPAENFLIHEKMATTLNVPIDDDFWYETYGVPKPDNYEALKAKKEEEKALLNTPPVPNPKDPKAPGTKDKKPDPKKEDPPKKKDPVELSEKAWYLKLFERFFPSAPAVTTGATVETCSHHHTIKLTDENIFDNDGLVRRVWAANGKLPFDPRLFYATSRTLVGGFKEGWDDAARIDLADAPGFEYGALDPAMLIAFEQNLFSFAGAKSAAQLQRLNQIFRGSNSFEEFYQQAMSVAEIHNKDWLQTEYTTAVLTGQASSTYHRLKKQIDIFPYWMYRDQGDDLVRKSHRALDGMVLRADDPRWAKLFPPNGWRCRCYVVPRMKHEVSEAQLKKGQELADAYLESPAFDREKNSGWALNRAATGTVFTKDQQYTAKGGKAITALTFSDFGLLPYSQARKSATEPLQTTPVSGRDFFDTLEDFEGGKVFRDYNKRPLTVTAKKLADGSSYIGALQKALASPDEVWMKGPKLSTIVYIKYYEGKTLIATGKIKNGRLQLGQWFELGKGKGTVTDYRKGLLIVRK